MIRTWQWFGVRETASHTIKKPLIHLSKVNLYVISSLFHLLLYYYFCSPFYRLCHSVVLTSDSIFAFALSRKRSDFFSLFFRECQQVEEGSSSVSFSMYFLGAGSTWLVHSMFVLFDIIWSIRLFEHEIRLFTISLFQHRSDEWVSKQQSFKYRQECLLLHVSSKTSLVISTRFIFLF